MGKKHLKALVETTHKIINLFWSTKGELRRQDHTAHPTGEAEAKGYSSEFSDTEESPRCRQAPQHLSLRKPAGDCKSWLMHSLQIRLSIRACPSAESRENTALCCKRIRWRSKQERLRWQPTGPRWSVGLGRSVNDLSKRLFPFLELPPLGQPHTSELPVLVNPGNKQVKKSLPA